MNHWLSIIISVCFAFASVHGNAEAARPQSLMQKVEASLAADGSFTPQETGQYIAALKSVLASYAFDMLSEKKKSDGADVLLAVLAEGSFDEMPVERTAEVAAAAYIATRRGSPPEVVEGIALYGFRQRVSADKIETWAKGYNDCMRNGVPADIAEDLVFNAAGHDWSIKTFNTLKWGLVAAAKEGFDMEDFQAHLMGSFIGSSKGPGAMVARSLRYFRELGDARAVIPEYKGSFVPRHERRKLESEMVEIKPAGSGKPSQGEINKSQKPASKVRGNVVVKPSAAESAPAMRDEHASAGPVKDFKKGPGFLERLEDNYTRFLGVPYVWGGETLRGTDCSGFVQSVYARMGIRLPRISRQQWRSGRRVSRGDLRKGDLVFFRTIGGRISHVGIFTEKKTRTFIHASSSKGVTYSKLTSRYYARRYAGARRVIPEGYASLMNILTLAIAGKGH